MNISAINVATKISASFKAQESPKPIIDIKGKEDNEVVGYSTWGNNYAYPITAGQIRTQQIDALKAEVAKSAYEVHKEEKEPEWYQVQRFNSPEYLG